MAGKTPAHPPQDPQTPRSMDLPGWLLSAEKNPPRGPQRGHPLLAAPHRRPTAPAHPPERLPTTQQLVKESCTVPRPLGYARASKSDDSQDTAAQVSALKSAGCTRVFEDRASGGR